MANSWQWHHSNFRGILEGENDNVELNMTDDHNQRRKQVIANTGGFIFENFMSADLNKNIVHVDEEFEPEVVKFIQDVRRRVQDFRRKIYEMDEIDLTFDFDDNGNPTMPTTREWVNSERRSFSAFIKGAPIWCQAPAVIKGKAADYGIWARYPAYTADEAWLLSLGIQPNGWLYIDLSDASGLDRPAHEPTHAIAQLRVLYQRKLDPAETGVKTPASEILVWLDTISLSVHPKFRNILWKSAQLAAKNSQTSDQGDEARPDARELASLKRLVITMAIDGYGFDPKAKKSPIPKQLEGIALQRGIPLTDETIRKWLRAASEFLPSKDEQDKKT